MPAPFSLPLVVFSSFSILFYVPLMLSLPPGFKVLADEFCQVTNIKYEDEGIKQRKDDTNTCENKVHNLEYSLSACSSGEGDQTKDERKH